MQGLNILYQTKNDCKIETYDTLLQCSKEIKHPLKYVYVVEGTIGILLQE